jgi:hypothetical protein
MKRVLLILLIAATAHADSGLVRLSETAEPWLITVMTDPTPIRGRRHRLLTGRSTPLRRFRHLP